MVVERSVMLNRPVETQRKSAGAASRRRRPQAARIVVALIVVGSLLGMTVSGSPLSVLAGGLALASIVTMLWRADDLPIFLVPVVYQWVEVATKPILTIIYREPIDHVLFQGSRVLAGFESAAIFGFAGVACLSAGIWLGARKSRANADSALRIEAQKWNQRLILQMSLGAIALGHLVRAFAGLTGPAYQLTLSLSDLEYVGVFVLAYWCFVNKAGYGYLLIVGTLEIIIGLTGYFADFRDPVLALAIAALAARPSFRPSSIAIAAVLAFCIIVVATFWSAIKSDYRDFVSAGTGAQVVSVPLEERLEFVYNAAANFDNSQFSEGFERLLSRLSYIDFLAATLSYVPAVASYQNGARIGKAFQNMLMPRLLFPDKPPLPSDTEVTMRYTGLYLGHYRNTSISIGYLGELYIDFGYWGALIATILIGAAVGIGYRTLRDYRRVPRVITTGVCAMFALGLGEFGTALVKFVNGAVLAFFAAFVIQRFIAPLALDFLVRRRARIKAH